MWFGESHPFPERGSPTSLSASGQQSYTGWSCRFVLSNYFFFRKSCRFLRCGKILYSEAGHRWQYDAYALHAECIRRQIDTLSFSTTTTDARTRLNVTVYVQYTARLVQIRYPARPKKFYYKRTPNVHQRSNRPELRTNQLPPWQKWQCVTQAHR